VSESALRHGGWQRPSDSARVDFDRRASATAPPFHPSDAALEAETAVRGSNCPTLPSSSIHSRLRAEPAAIETLIGHCHAPSFSSVSKARLSRARQHPRAPLAPRSRAAHREPALALDRHDAGNIARCSASIGCSVVAGRSRHDSDVPRPRCASAHVRRRRHESRRRGRTVQRLPRTK